MNKFGTWLSDSDFYQMFFVDDDYGFYIDEKIEGNQEENLKQDDIIRHYDVTGKECPRYFVKHPEAWEKFLSDL